MEVPADERIDESPICRASQSPGRQGFTLFWPIRGPKNGAHLIPDFWLLLHVAVRRERIWQAAEHYVEAARVYRHWAVMCAA